MARKRTTVNLADAKARLSELVRRASAGEEIVIARDHKPVARLTAVHATGRRRPGTGRGMFTHVSPGFDDPLPDFDEHME
jgi:prevent-host-death family protein